MKCYFIFLTTLIIAFSVNSSFEYHKKTPNKSSYWNSLKQIHKKVLRRNRNVKEIERKIEDVMDKTLNKKGINEIPSKQSFETNQERNYYNDGFFKDYYDPMIHKIHNKLPNTMNNAVPINPMINSQSKYGKVFAKLKPKLNPKASQDYNLLISKNMPLKNKQIVRKNLKKKVKNLKRFTTENTRMKIEVIESSKLPLSVRKDKKYIHYLKCSKKTGFLNYYQGMDDKIATVIPIYLTLSREVLRLFQSVSESSLISSIHLNSIQRIDQSLKNTFCFDIIINEIVQLKTLETRKVILCANNLKIMNEWIKSILEFKECVIHEDSHEEKGKVLIDFSKTNRILTTNLSAKQMELENLYYDGTDTAYKNHIIKSKEEIVDKDMGEIQEIIKLGRIAKLQLKRRLRGRLANSRKMTSAFLNKVGMKNLITNRISAIKQRENVLFTEEKRVRKKKLIEKLKNKLKKIKKDELRDYQASYETEINLEKEKANNEAKNIIKTISTQKKLKNFSSCLNSKLYRFKNSKYVKDVCYSDYGKYGMNTCSQKAHFCDYCCEFKIGVGLIEIRSSCKFKCTLLINGKVKNLDEEIGKLNKEFRKMYEKKLQNLMKGKIDSKGKMRRLAKLLKSIMEYSKSFKEMIKQDLSTEPILAAKRKSNLSL